MPPSRQDTIYTQKRLALENVLKRFLLFVDNIPVIHAPGKNPIRYPPEGPRIASVPDLPPANTGRPIDPRVRYKSTAQVPPTGPRTNPASMAPRL